MSDKLPASIVLKQYDELLKIKPKKFKAGFPFNVNDDMNNSDFMTNVTELINSISENIIVTKKPNNTEKKGGKIIVYTF